jgi:uncharacterized glyoxalase superfamily protein PhnB
MTTRTSAQATIEVAVDPQTAFAVFTEEIDRWWVPGPINNWNSSRAIGRRFERGVGGRFLELYDEVTGECLELGRITVWEPGARLVYRSSVDDTEVDIRFQPTTNGTLVRVDHYLLPGGDADKAALFWPNVIRWLGTWVGERDTAPKEPRKLAPLSVGLYYRDPAAAARWLNQAFGLTSWDGIPGEGEQTGWLELHVGNVAILLFEGEKPPEGSSHVVWVYVDDLDGHFAQAEASGAKIVSPIDEHGYRSYEAEDLEGHRWTFVQRMPSTA